MPSAGPAPSRRAASAGRRFARCARQPPGAGLPRRAPARPPPPPPPGGRGAGRAPGAATPQERQGLEAVLGVAGEIADGVARRKLGPADALRLAAEASELAELLSQGGQIDHAWTAVLRAAEQAGSVAAYCDGAAL